MGRWTSTATPSPSQSSRRSASPRSKNAEGSAKLGRVPIRTCLVCRGAGPKADLLRLVLDAGAVTVDVPAHRPGRGAYLCHRVTCLEGALRRDARALRRALRVGPAAAVDSSRLRAQWGEAVSGQGSADEGGRRLPSSRGAAGAARE